MFGFFNKFDRQKKLAESGDPIAQYNLGICYVKGDGVPQDLAEAAKWFRNVADQGFAQGQYRLGLQYAIGHGVAKDMEEAAKWYRLAADQGYPPAQYLLGRYYEYDCVSRTSDERLGFSYNDGRVTRNLVEAYKWYDLASAQGYVDEIEGSATTKRDAVAAEIAKMTPDDIAFLGDCYNYGKNVPKDYAEAAKWYHKAAERGHARAQCNLGDCYEKGKGVTQDYQEAVKWYRKASEKNLAVAHCSLGDCYANGWGLTKDFVEAYKWFHLASSQGYSDATTERDALAALMTPDQIAKAQKLCREL